MKQRGKDLLLWAGVVILVILAAAVRLVLESAFYFFTYLFLGFGAMLALYILSRHMKGRGGQYLRRALAVVLIAGGAYFVAMEGIILLNGGTRIDSEPDVVMIMGAHVRPEGPSPNLQARLDAALPYLQEHPEVPVVVAGGQGGNEHIPEAECMYDYLTARGIAPERIWQEDESHNTMQNFSYTAQLLEEKGLDAEECHILVVSSSWHLCRVRLLAGRAGLDISTLAAPPSHLGYAFGNYIRETVALAKSFVFDR